VTNTSRVGELVDVAVANGATGVRNVEFTLSEESQSELRNQALEEAMGAREPRPRPSPRPKMSS